MRAPKCASAFALLCGAGLQLTAIYLILLCFFFWNMLSHLTFRPALYYTCIVALASTSYLNGYGLVRVMRLFGSLKSWKCHAVFAASLVPWWVMLHILAIDVLETLESAHEEISMTATVLSFLLWLLISIPLTYLGAHRAMVAAPPAMRSNRIPRAIPEELPFFLHWVWVTAISSCTIFCTIGILFKFMW